MSGRAYGNISPILPIGRDGTAPTIITVNLPDLICCFIKPTQT
ncbi:hypothetical protein AVDCRST_MAG84-1755 [uncultured Microcoleus sp.]|uniref:Uncharacterized protein n=1 Tax=uncultured Microcoleus sp. TaxID=259945 RepID=A0A6J4LAS3_9CYAN|nr:hypothetical protein AVDCRST_MAG84-1755 [uncultured Microcoleus sp.]